jgi:hypothetical protein
LSPACSGCTLEQTWNVNSIFHWKAGGLVEAAQQFLGNNPLEILFLAFDAISRTPVCLYGQQCEDGIDVTQLDNTPALRSVMLVVDMVVDMTGGPGTDVVPVAVAHLRCTAAAAIQLRDAIDKALLIGAPVQNPEGKAN